MPEEVRIVARFDDTDIVNGVQRSEAAAREMKQVWETSMNIDFPSGGGGAGGGGIAGKLWPDPEGDGAQAGSSFMRGFVGKLLLRDAIYGLISGIMTAIGTAMDDLNKAVGDKTAHEGFWKNVGHTLSFTTRMLVPSINQSDVAQTGAEIAQENAIRQMDRIVQGARENPDALRPTSQYEAQLSGIMDQREQHQHEYDTQRRVLAESGQDNPTALAGLRSNFEPQDRYFQQMEEHLRELVSLGKERDKKSNEDAKRASEADFKARNSEIDAQDKMRGDQRRDSSEDAKKAAEAAKEAERVRKNRRGHEIEGTLSTDEKDRTADEKDLKFTEDEIKKTKATSAVVINGGVFGRSDSVGALVSHAAQQVSLLRSIDSEIKQLRKEKSDLTLL